MEDSISYFKIRGLVDQVCEIHNGDGVHFKPYGIYQIFRAVRGAVCFGPQHHGQVEGRKAPLSVTLVSIICISLTGLFVNIVYLLNSPNYAFIIIISILTRFCPL